MVQLEAGIRSFDANDFPVRVAAEVKDFDPTTVASPKDARRLDRNVLLALAAAIEAVEDAGLRDFDPTRVGIVLGSAIGGIGGIEEQDGVLRERGPARVSPNFIPNVLVEAMARPGVELIVGVRGDPDWGPVLMVGLGGVWAEALRDVRLLPPDLDPAAIVGELRKLKAAPLLTGFRGTPALDLGAVADVASKLGRFAAAHPEIAEIDINPLVVYPEQEGAVALDALIVAR